MRTVWSFGIPVRNTRERIQLRPWESIISAEVKHSGGSASISLLKLRRGRRLGGLVGSGPGGSRFPGESGTGRPCVCSPLLQCWGSWFAEGMLSVGAVRQREEDEERPGALKRGTGHVEHRPSCRKVRASGLWTVLYSFKMY